MSGRQLQLKPIEWEDTQYGGENGRVGGVFMFTIAYNASLPKGSDKPQFVVDTVLPGFKKRLPAASREEGRALAERILRRHVLRLLAENAEGGES